jgi:hypothetical protein
MTDREEQLRGVAAEVSDHQAIDDAFTAKSFTDLLVIVDVEGMETVPDDVVKLLAEYDCYGADRVYGDDGGNHSFLGDVGNGTRHHFVDVRTRGSHQSYVID